MVAFVFIFICFLTEVQSFFLPSRRAVFKSVFVNTHSNSATRLRASEDDLLNNWDSKLMYKLRPKTEDVARFSGDQTDNSSIMEWLKQQGWTNGLSKAAIHSEAKFFKKYFVLDDSGSMQTNDGHILVAGTMPFTQRFVKCSRWKELIESVKFHAKLADAIQVDTEFSFLNSASPFTVGNDSSSKCSPGSKLSQANDIIKSAEAGGGTPLCKQINEIEKNIRSNLSNINIAKQCASITIMTDGEATDGDLLQALQKLKGLPV